MVKQCTKWGLAVTLGLAALCFGLAPPASAATLSFSAFVFSREGRELGVNSYYGSEGAPPGLGFEHEALSVDYTTSGLPYHISNVKYIANGASKFVATGGGPYPVGPTPYAQPITIANLGAPLGGSVSPIAMPTLTPGSGVFGNTLSQNYAFGEFQQGTDNSEVTYVEIDNAAGEMAGVKYGNDLLPFQGSTIVVTFMPDPGAPSVFTPIVLTAAFGIQSSPPYNPATGPKGQQWHNIGLTGKDIEIAVVPEPGSLAMLLGLGVAGSMFVFRRRRAA